MRNLIVAFLVAVAPFASPAAAISSAHPGAATAAVPGFHDFDFLVGQWLAHHRKLKRRLANDHEWIEFEGTLVNQPLMAGYSNVDDTVLKVRAPPIAESHCGHSTQRLAGGRSGGSTAERHPNLWIRL